MKTVGIGVIGCGYIGSKRARTAVEHGRSRVEVVADIDPVAGGKLAKTVGCAYTSDWREVVCSPAVDAVVVAVTNNYLAPIAAAALESGKDVLCEKPLALTAAEAGPLVAAGKEKAAVLKVGLSLRHHPAIAAAREKFAQKQVGEPLLLRCRYGHGGRPGYEREWRSQPAISGGGELLDQGIHVADLFNWFMGDFHEAAGFCATNFWRAPQIEDNAFALFRTKDGRLASFHVSCTQWKNLFSLEAFGDQGHLRVEGLGGSYGPEKLVVSRGAGNGACPEEETIDFTDGLDCWTAEWFEFMAAVDEKRRPLGDGADAYRALQMVEAVYRAQAEGRVVQLEPEGTHAGEVR